MNHFQSLVLYYICHRPQKNAAVVLPTLACWDAYPHIITCWKIFSSSKVQFKGHLLHWSSCYVCLSQILSSYTTQVYKSLSEAFHWLQRNTLSPHVRQHRSIWELTPLGRNLKQWCMCFGKEILHLLSPSSRMTLRCVLCHLSEAPVGLSPITYNSDLLSTLLGFLRSSPK